jgi:Tfp pilus assembly protein PilF
MRPEHPDPNDSLSLATVKRIDEVCERFEAVWHTGPAPRLEDFLGAAQAWEREALLRELLRVEVDCRQRQGNVPAVDDYAQRFPDHESAIRKAVAAAERVRKAEEERAAAQARAAVERRARHVTLGLAAALLLAAGGFVGWLMEQERSAAEARQREADRAVQTALEEARALLDQGWQLDDGRKLGEAKATAAMAQELARNASPDVQQEAEGLYQDIHRLGALVEKHRALLVKLHEVSEPLPSAPSAQQKLNEVDASLRGVLDLQPEYAPADNRLAVPLPDPKKLDNAVTSCRKAIELQPDYSEAYNTLGVVLYHQKKLDEAVASYRKAIALKTDFAEAYSNFAVALVRQKRLSDAVTVLRKAKELLPNHPVYGNNLRVAERMLELEKKLPAILAKKEQPRNIQERIELAALCLKYNQQYAAAAGFFREVFVAEPKLAEDLRYQFRSQAARAAVLAAAGQGTDARDLAAKERGKLRQQALQWLRTDLDAYTKQAEQEAKPARQAVGQRLSRWLQDGDLATVRETKDLAALPETERKLWQRLWQDVAGLRKKCQ